MEEEQAIRAIREVDRAYWLPLKAELEPVIDLRAFFCDVRR